MTIQSGSDLAGMRAAGKLVAQALREMRSVVSPGMTTGQLDDFGAAFLRKRGDPRSSPLSGSTASVNDEAWNRDGACRATSKTESPRADGHTPTATTLPSAGTAPRTSTPRRR
jgi:hypothetical protein